MVEILNLLNMCKFGCEIHPALSKIKSHVLLFYLPLTHSQAIPGQEDDFYWRRTNFDSQTHGSVCRICKMSLVSSKAGQYWVAKYASKHCAYRNSDMKQPDW
jgi:hypothetical protein